jgi:hypothetical protein
MKKSDGRPDSRKSCGTESPVSGKTETLRYSFCGYPAFRLKRSLSAQRDKISVAVFARGNLAKEKSSQIVPGEKQKHDDRKFFTQSCYYIMLRYDSSSLRVGSS